VEEWGTARKSAKVGLVALSAPAGAAEILPERDLYFYLSSGSEVDVNWTGGRSTPPPTGR